MSASSSCYVFIASRQTDPCGKDVSASEIFRRLLMERECWLLAPYTPFRAAYKPEDRIAFYLAGPRHRYFAGTAIVADEVRSISDDNAQLLRGLGLHGYAFELPMKTIVLWDRPKPIMELVQDLTFIKDKRNYGLHLRQGAVSIAESDYQLIAGIP